MDVKKVCARPRLEYVAEVEVLPKVTLGDYKKLGVKKVVGKVAASDVDEIIERMQTGTAERKEVKRAAKR